MIYVDKLKQHGSREWCHLVTDGALTELHTFAKKIGCKSEWFQPKSSPHYDLTPYMRFKAVKAGASEISDNGLAKLISKTKADRALEASKSDATAGHQGDF